MSDNEESRGLSPLAYEDIPGDEYPPYVSADQEPAELTLRAVVIGAIIGTVFGAANAYLGLRVGLTVSASIPAAVLGVAAFKAMGQGSILETNMVQTIGSAGESLAAGVIFTLAGLYIWELDPGYATVFLIALLGGFLGILFMIPLRTFLIKGEHGKLPYPEGMACGEVLVAGEQEASKVKSLFGGLGIGALYQSLMHGNLFGLWREEPTAHVPGYRGAEVGATVTPELLGVGYIIGPRISAVMLSGGALGWLVLIPLVKLVGDGLGAPMYPATDMLISEMAPIEIWSNYIRYIGAGAVAVGGFMTLIKSIPVIWSSFKKALETLTGESKSAESIKRTDRDLDPRIFIGLLAAIIITLAVLPPSIMPAGPLGAGLMALFAFFFVTVSSRIVGLIGSSSNPVSGMTIATLLVTAVLFVWLGRADMPNARFAVLAVGAVVCIAAAIAGDTSQDLKTGFLVGATPYRQQIGEFIGVAASALVMGFVLRLLHAAYGIGSEQLAAPQAQIMTMVIDGVLSGELPWNLVFIGGMIAALVELLGLPSLALAVGLYLPLSLTTPIMAGGAIRGILEKTYGGDDKDHGEKEELRDRRESGVLYASGMIAGAALIGVVAAGFIALSQAAGGPGVLGQIGNFSESLLASLQSVGDGFRGLFGETGKDLVSITAFGILAASLVWVVFGKRDD
jgi:putative OPT family oligopeptide transporter